MRLRVVERWVERQNQRVDGGCVVIHCQQVIGGARWRVSIEVGGHRPFNIANGYGLPSVLRDAERWLDERSKPGIFEVAPYLEGEEYAHWCDPFRRGGHERRLFSDEDEGAKHG